MPVTSVLQNKKLNYYSYVKKVIIIIILLFIIIVALLWLWNNYFLWQKNSGYLADYELIDGPVRIADNAGQSSGLTFDASLNQLYVIVNSPQQIHRLNASGEYLSSVDLKGFTDTEGIAFLGNEQFVLVDEREGIISWFTMNLETKTIEFKPDQSIKIFPHNVGNIGLEGITYDRQSKQLFVVKDRKPKKIYALQWPVSDIKQPVINTPWNAEEHPWWLVRNFSGIHYHKESGHLFILSRRSRTIIEYTLSGQKVGSFSLKSGSAKLQQTIGKAEGIVIASNGTLYLCAELNQLYIFKKRTNY